MRWKVEWLVDRSREPASIPAYRFLKFLPVNVRIQLLAILGAVRTTGPDRSDRDYEIVGALAARIEEDPPPFGSVDDFIQADLR